jgi:hypothetical protein
MTAVFSRRRVLPAVNYVSLLKLENVSYINTFSNGFEALDIEIVVLKFKYVWYFEEIYCNHNTRGFLTNSLNLVSKIQCSHPFAFVLYSMSEENICWYASYYQPEWSEKSVFAVCRVLYFLIIFMDF